MFTAAHCIQDKNVEQPRALDSFYALIARFDLKADESGSTRGFFSSIRIHPDWDYNSTRYDADIAVLVLKDKITYGTFVQPACLPEPTTNVFNIRGTVVGYGLTENTDTNEDRPKFVEIPSVDNEECYWNSDIFHISGSRRSFCAGDRGKRACRGDSGGGFYVKNSDTYTVNGIVSSGSFNCDEGKYVVFTSVPLFVDWIREEMEKKDKDEERGSGATLICKFRTTSLM
jgi:secreted trypsin-like serine protease